MRGRNKRERAVEEAAMEGTTTNLGCGELMSSERDEGTISAAHIYSVKAHTTGKDAINSVWTGSIATG